jgi:aminodeoxyfutalosine synthase
MPNMLEGIAARVDAGERLTDKDAEDLVSTSDIVSLGMLAEEARRRRHGDRVTFLRVAHVMWADAAGANPFLVSAGEIRLEGMPESVDAAVGAVRAVVARAGNVPVSAFSLAQLQCLSRAAGAPLDACLGRLRDAGLERIADVSLDDALEFEDAMEAAARAGVGTPRVGFEHAADDWLERLHRVVCLQDTSRSIRVLSPLPSRLNPAVPTSGYEDLKRVSIARLLAANIETIQVDWSLYGPKLAQVALTFGADDIDNVPAAADPTLGPRRAPLEEVRRNITAASLVPVERNGRWELFPNPESPIPNP